MDSRKLILCRGIQGSGKSTWAKQWVAEDPKHRVRFNNDDIRNMLGPYWVPEREPLVGTMKNIFLSNAMLLGYDIVIDNMNLNPREVKFYEDIVERVNNPTGIIPNTVVLLYSLEFKDFKTPLEECIERDSKRPNSIGAEVITATFNKYKEFYKNGEVCNM